jgi:hypothetical protein
VLVVAQKAGKYGRRGAVGVNTAPVIEVVAYLVKRQGLVSVRQENTEHAFVEWHSGSYEIRGFGTAIFDGFEDIAGFCFTLVNLQLLAALGAERAFCHGG